MNGLATVTVAGPGDTHADRLTNRPMAGSLRAIAAEVWRSVHLFEASARVTVHEDGPLAVAVRVKIDALIVGPWRRRRLTRIAHAAAYAACPVGVTPTVRIVEVWRRD